MPQLQGECSYRRVDLVRPFNVGPVLDLNQALTLVHFSAQPEPFLTQRHTLNTPNTPYQPTNTPETTPNCTPCHTECA